MKKILIIISILCAFTIMAMGCTTVNKSVKTEETVMTEPAQRVWLDVPYANQSEKQKLDIHLPETGNGPFPVVFYVHGGGFIMGDKLAITSSIDWTEKGYALVRVNYRLAAEAIFPAAVYDVKAAIRFIKANAKEYHLDTDRIAAWGDSAGGYLVSMLGTSVGVEELEDLSMGNADQSTEVQVVVDLFGPINFLKMDKQFAESDISPKAEANAEDSFASQFLGAALPEIPELVAMADPTTYISRDCPIFYIQHGKKDNLVPVQQSIDFAKALKRVIGRKNVTLKIYENGGHNSDEFRSQENYDLIFDFLNEHLK